MSIPSEGVVRVDEVRTDSGEVEGIRLTRVQYSGAKYPQGLNDGDTLIVSSLSAMALQNLPAPNGVSLTSPGKLVRDDKGRPVGCQGLTLWN